MAKKPNETTGPKPLNEIQKLQLLNLSKDVQVTQLQLQNAQLQLQQSGGAFQRARAAFDGALKAVAVEGYVLDPQLNWITKAEADAATAKAMAGQA